MTAPPISIDGVVRWTVAAFHANPEADDGEIVQVLRAAGLPHAGRAVAMVPLAYGRRILDGLVTLAPTFVDDDGEAALADDPVFAAADRIARAEATRVDLDVIGRRSSEVHAVDAALHHGSKPEDLVLSSPRMMRSRDDDHVDPAIPTAPDAQAIVDALVRAHGASIPLEARIFPRSLQAGRVQLQLDAVVHVGGGRGINESFAGTGATVHGAIGDAIAKLTRASLHPMMAVLEARALGADQVDWETWGDFDVCLGLLLRMWSEPGPDGFSAYLAALKERVLAAGLTRELHWLRTFIATDGTKILGLDMLLDNDPWPPGVELAETWPWPKTSTYYALRQFLILVPR